MPPLMKNHGCYVGSLGEVCRWLAGKAEALGVDISPGSLRPRRCTTRAARSSALRPATRGLAGRHAEGIPAGHEIAAKYTLIAEGARGSLPRG